LKEAAPATLERATASERIKIPPVTLKAAAVVGGKGSRQATTASGSRRVVYSFIQGTFVMRITNCQKKVTQVCYVHPLLPHCLHLSVLLLRTSLAASNAAQISCNGLTLTGPN